MFCVFIAVEGFTLPSGFIVKELTMMFGNHQFNHYLFEPPVDFVPTREDLTTIRYTTNQIHGLNFTDGTLAYDKLYDILSKLHDHKVHCYGEHTKRLLQSHVPFTPIFNIQDVGFTMPETLPSSSCGRNHHGRNCSMSKATVVRNFFLM